MKTPTHTPGPWAMKSSHGLWAVNVNDGDREYLFQHEANARLIAAAPELLAALRGLVARLESADPDWFTDECEGFDLYQAHSAIAKAIGH